jgi:hypothetical protein
LLSRTLSFWFSFRLFRFQPDANAAVILGDELDAGLFECAQPHSSACFSREFAGDARGDAARSASARIDYFLIISAFLPVRVAGFDLQLLWRTSNFRPLPKSALASTRVIENSEPNFRKGGGKRPFTQAACQGLFKFSFFYDVNGAAFENITLATGQRLPSFLARARASGNCAS